MPSGHAEFDSERRRPADFDVAGAHAEFASDRRRPIGFEPSSGVPLIATDITSVRFRLPGVSYVPRFDDVSPVTFFDGPITWIDADMLTGTTQSNITAGQTIYVGLFEDADFNDVSIPLPAGQAVHLIAEANAAPGSGETFTYTITRNGVDTSMSVTVSDLATSGSTIANPVTLSTNGDKLAVKIVTSSNAATAKHRFSIRYQISA